MRLTRIACALSGISTLVGASVALGQDTIATERVIASGVQRPVYLTHAGDPGRAFVVQQRGLIRVLDLETDTFLSEPFIDLSSRVSQSGNERGLLGLAFHPDYASNGLFYVNYTHISTGATVVAQLNVSAADPNVADPNSFVQIISYSQPFSNHNGGWIGFGPDDYLYIASGDGGSGNDPGNRAQTIDGMLLGKMLRIDVNDDGFPDDSDRNYAIPATNPFVGVACDDE
ncbi:MAG: PQQ-dependent sugar dehydrogenase, partial [Phycisphaerales bacterium JB041]